MSARIRWFLYWGPPLVWMALIFLGSSIPGGEADRMTRSASGVEDPVRIQRIKDAAHVIEYGILALLLIRAAKRDATRLSWRHAGRSFALAALYGVSDELHQAFVPFRTPGLDDIVRNVAGSGLGVLIMIVRVRLPGSKKTRPGR